MLRYLSDEKISAVLDEFDALLAIKETTVTKTGDKTVIKDVSNHLIIAGGDEVKVNEQKFHEYKERVKKARQSIINPE